MVRRMIALLGTIAVLALMTQAHSSAVIEQCTMKSNAEVKTLPTANGHLVFSVPQELSVEVLEEYGTNQWAWIASTDNDYAAAGWVRRSSLKTCWGRREKSR
jgi:hypothetical protein